MLVYVSLRIGLQVVAQIVRDVKSKAKISPLASGSSIAEGLVRIAISDVPCPVLPKVSSLARTANRYRQKSRPKDPKDLQFDIESLQLPADFHKGDIHV